MHVLYANPARKKKTIMIRLAKARRLPKHFEQAHCFLIAFNVLCRQKEKRKRETKRYIPLGEKKLD